MEEDKRYIGAGAKRTALLHLGTRLRQARYRRHMTQSQVAKTLGTSPQTLRNWEAGRHEPPSSAVKALADLYRIREERLLEGLDTAITPTRPGFRYNRVVVEPEKLSQARRDAGMTQTEVSILLGLSLSAIRRYESGMANPETNTLETLATIYGRPAEWFTPRGYFTDDERQRFEESVTPRAAKWSDSDIVIKTYDQAQADLSEEAKLRIAKFIEFTQNVERRGFRFKHWRRADGGEPPAAP